MMSLREQLMRDEGLRLKPYADSVGKLTVGYGHNLTDDGLPQAIAEALLDFDITAATADLYRTLDWAWSLSEPRRGVLINMTFNLGIAGLLEFRKALAAMKVGDWATAAKEMLASKWAEQVGPRAHRLAQQVLTDEWT